MEQGNYVFHFTGKANQSYVMKNDQGEIVYEAICEKISLFKDTPYRFCDRITGQETQRMVSHTVTHALKINGFGGNISSSFKLDKQVVWQVLADMGYDFHFRIQGLHACFDLTRDGQPVGTLETAGTGLMNPKYANSPVGKVPTNGIYRVCCSEEDIPGFFLVCFTLAKTEFAMNLLK